MCSFCYLCEPFVAIQMSQTDKYKELFTVAGEN